MTAVDAGGKNLVFIVGSPRSGTTWLARLMGAHPEVAATQETELVNRYLRPWYDAWDAQLPADADQWHRHRYRGLPSVLTVQEFEDSVGGLARAVYAKVLGLKPTARVVVDKNPEYSLHVGMIRRVFPDAAVLHLVRDGRAVAASMLAASRGWGRDWAPTNVRLAAQTWRANVEGARSAADSGRYLEVRYEELTADGPGVLSECLRFAGVDSDPGECHEIVRRFSLGEAADKPEESFIWSGEVVKRLGAVPAEPQGFSGSASTNGWQRTWSGWQRLTFAHVAGDLLRDLSYAADDDWVRPPWPLATVSAVVERILHVAPRLGWRLHMWLGRRGLYVHLARINPYG